MHETNVFRDTRDKVDLMETTLADIRAANAKGGNNAGIFVVYDLPDRDCAAAASNGEYSIANGGVANYKAYIDAIVKVLKSYSDVKVILVIGQYKTRVLPIRHHLLTCNQSLIPSPTWLPT
jgi:cellulase/cellobiase CelA1